ncbi:MAG TPA: class I SAM-dependent methyltransferase [Polyangia bacterium]|nr:class I SAM-dependent methyltransferase [Polyangia bacterium]
MTVSRASQSFAEKAGEAWVRMQDRTDALIEPLGRVAMERLAPVAGERVVDVGCGCGQTLLQLADLAGPSGHVLGVDISPPMLGRARERVAGRPTIALALADAQTHAFAPGSFDAVYSRFGVMFFEDPRAAFSNLRGAVRSGGRLSFVCWQDLAKNLWAARPLEAVMRLLPAAAMPDMLREGRPGPFFLSDPARVQAILGAAGWKDVSLEPVEMPLHVGGAATLGEAVAYSLQIGPAARAMADAPDDLKPALEVALRKALAPFASARGVFMDGAAFVVRARA